MDSRFLNQFLNRRTHYWIDSYQHLRLHYLQHELIDDEEKVSGNIMKSKIFKDSKTCSTVDLTKSEGDYSALLDEIERVVKSL